MEALDLARWQFGITTVYHFIFVPLTIGLAPLVAIMQTMWVVKKQDHWLKLTKFFGKLFLINFALGVVTGIVQEFQFGMGWSAYSKFVGDIFGAPLAMEALAAFFIESTFLGLWIFGWDRLPKKVHLTMIWLVAVAVNLSAFFILAANSFMQHPVGAVYNPDTGRAEMTDIGAVLSNPTVLAAFPHTVTAAFLVAGTFVAGIAGWWIVRSVRMNRADVAKGVYKPAVTLGVVTMLIAGVGVLVSGDFQGKLMYEQQPMKMASAEALCETETSASFSFLAIGDFTNDCDNVKRILSIPGVTSFLAKSNFDAEVPGVANVQADYQAKYGADQDYRPNLVVSYWSFRLMIGLAIFSVILALAALIYLRKGRVTDSKWFKRICLVALPMPFLACSFGWIFTEMGRQPWIVAPNPANYGTDAEMVRFLTKDAVSASVPASSFVISLVVFTLVYGALAVAWFYLQRRYAMAGVEMDTPEPTINQGDEPLTFAY